MKNSDKTLVVLFTYGGGMRGLVPAHLMTRMEEATGLRMADMVDVFAGPSTGAILNAALTRPHPDDPGRPLYKARHLVKFYEREGINIFPPDQFRDFRGILHDFNRRTLKLSQLNWILRYGHYDPANLGHALRNLYGDAKLSDSLSSLVIPTYNIDGEQLKIAREKDETGDSPAPTINNLMDEGGHAVWLKHIRHDYPAGTAVQTPDVGLYDAVMASCAAPTYFPCHHFTAGYSAPRGEVAYSGIDGVIFDNPCISYLGAIRRHVPRDYRLVMIILGTGYTNRSIKKEDWNRYGSLGVVDPVNDLPLINIFFHASESALLEEFAADTGDDLYVFNKSMLGAANNMNVPSIQIDDASPENLQKLNLFANEIYEENKEKFDRLCAFLAARGSRSSRQQRSEARRPRRFFSLFTGQNA